jgi:hypothetical protein
LKLRTTTVAALLAGLTAMALPTNAAGAATTAPSSCPSPALLQAYKAFGDARWYELAPGASFEAGAAAWTLKTGAKVVAGNEPWYLNKLTDTWSLSLPPGASATSPAMCVDIDYPTFRLPVRAYDPNGATDLDIEVRYPDAGDSSWKKVRTESGKLHEGWRVTSDIDLKPDTYSGQAGQRRVDLRFSARGKTGAPGWRIDDVYVDPRMRG